MDVTQVLTSREAIEVYVNTRPRVAGRTAQRGFLIQAGNNEHIVTGTGKCLTCGVQACSHTDAVERHLRS